MPELDAEARILLSLPDGVRDRVQQLRAPGARGHPPKLKSGHTLAGASSTSTWKAN